MTTQAYSVRTADVSHNAFEDEVIVVNLATGSYFSLYNTSAEIWRLLVEGPGSGASLAAAFPSAGANAAAEIQAFLEQLAANQLLSPTSAPTASTASPLPYTPPTLDVFDELRDLLLADVIHDVDEQGWPNVLPPGPADRAA